MAVLVARVSAAAVVVATMRGMMVWSSLLSPGFWQ